MTTKFRARPFDSADRQEGTSTRAQHLQNPSHLTRKRKASSRRARATIFSPPGAGGRRVASCSLRCGVRSTHLVPSQFSLSSAFLSVFRLHRLSPNPFSPATIGRVQRPVSGRIVKCRPGLNARFAHHERPLSAARSDGNNALLGGRFV